MSAPSGRRGFLRALAAFSVVAPGGLHVNQVVASAADPDALLQEAGVAWERAVLAYEDARHRYGAAVEGYKQSVGPCPRELIISEQWDVFCAVFRDGSRGHVPLVSHPDWDVINPAEHSWWQVQVWTRRQLRQAIARAPRALGRAGTTPNQIRAWRALLPVAEARDRVRATERRRWRVEAFDREVALARERIDSAREDIMAIRAVGLLGLAVKTRLAQHELALSDREDRFPKRENIPRWLLDVLDSAAQMGNPAV